MNTNMNNASMDVEYYKLNSPASVMDLIHEKKLPFELGNALKYILRAGKKENASALSDLKKAIHYLTYYVSVMEE